MANCSGNAISDFGMYLSQDSIRNYTNINLDPPPYNFPDFVPQIVNKKGILKDTVNWIEISDVYKAKGDENWITVGCFKKIITYDSIANSNGAQYYFDDVFVYEIESIVAEDTICLGDSTPLIANSKSAFYWSNNYLGTDTISLDSIFWVKPTATAQYFLIAQTFTDSLTLHVVTPQVIPLPADTFKCSNEGIILDAGNGNAAYYWSTGQKEQTLTVNNPGLYSVLVYNTVGCKSTASVTVADFPYAVPELGNDTVVCFEEVQPLLTAINAKRYYWEPFGETSASIIVNSPGTYNLQITDSNNCKFTDTITIDNYCNYPAWFPNAFSPGTNDTLNRIFRPVIYNLIEYNLQVFTRWGEKIFETNDYSEGWDGYYKGQPLEAGQYMYLATYAQVIDGKKTWNSKNGIVYLVR
ncbi:MAG TPA: gliding motility-associated C-terminal domain-containing protein [Bacteroidia bacterium]|nr:gliding motility-associated C-terminal domain-containing protein [Bacteroidia bacterium]